LGAPDIASPLVRLLGETTPAEAGGTDFAERLGAWLNAFDAIGVQSALRAMHEMQPAPMRPRSAGERAAPLGDDLQRVRGVLATAIDKASLTAAQPEDGYAPYRDRHLELQRQMELMIRPLRAHVRESASRRSTRLRQLAILDAAMEQVLARREQSLLPLIPALLKRRFEQLRKAAGGEAADGAWLQAFAREWRQALVAELDVRLAPVSGLVDAAAKE